MQINWNAVWRLMRFDRPIGILLLLWPTLWALWIAGEGRPSIKNVLIFCTGVVLMRAAGCIMNDVADRNFDPHVEGQCIKRRQKPEDLVGTLLFLASSDSDMITGQIINVDGGYNKN